MGEYAIRIDRKEVKIGTCKMMYYLRYEDRNNLTPKSNNLDPANTLNLFWRLPYPDEDHIAIGDYKQYNRGLLLVGFSFLDSALSPGLIQISHPCGYLININCYHGVKLPVGSADIKPHWNGMANNFFELGYLKNTKDGIYPIVKCRFCQTMWPADWKEIEPFLDVEMANRLSQYF